MSLIDIATMAFSALTVVFSILTIKANRRRQRTGLPGAHGQRGVEGRVHE